MTSEQEVGELIQRNRNRCLGAYTISVYNYIHNYLVKKTCVETTYEGQLFAGKQAIDILAEGSPCSNVH